MDVTTFLAESNHIRNINVYRREIGISNGVIGGYKQMSLMSSCACCGFMFFQPCRLSHRCKRLLVNRCVSRTGCLGDLVVLNDYKTVQSNASVVTSQLLIDGVLLDIANLDVASLAVGGAFMDCNPISTRFADVYTLTMVEIPIPWKHKALSRTWHVKVAAITLQMRGLGCLILRITTAKGAGSSYKMCKEDPHISASNIIKCSRAKLLQIPVANEDPSRK